jgi:Ca2+-transporting ATPase
MTNGEVKEVGGYELVPGDVVLLKSGDKVPADLRLIESRSLKVEEAPLTGESLSVEKDPRPVDRDAALGDRTCMAYSGTLVTYGVGAGVVIGTGQKTELGKISNLLGSTTRIDTPLMQSLARFGSLITIAIAFVAIALLVVGYLRGLTIADAALAAITLAVAAIPEGLPAIVTITLAIGVRRMAARRAVIRSLPAVETLGCTSAICTDKTGTLTKNEMTVTALWTPFGKYRLTGSGYDPDGLLLQDGVPVEKAPQEIWPLLKAGVICNDSQLLKDVTLWVAQGDPTEVALLVSFAKLGGVRAALDQEHPRLDVQPFESDLQYMATLNSEKDGCSIYLKGAPEVVLAKCFGPLEEARKAVNSLAAEGMRVLAFAKKSTTSKMLSREEQDHGFELLGLQAMIDPPRSEVIEAIKDCHEAGIVVKMITGDHKITAKEIARQIGILGTGSAYSGDEITALNDDELVLAAQEANVFARVTPEQKLRLVKALQSTGVIVSMTGDGVNDAPALKQANIGVAMGITGTSVSKESADLVLTDDNFASIRAAVEEGRRIYDNLIKSLAFILPTNLGEALIILVAVATFPTVAGQILMPILPVQILWINLVATIALALPLAFESPELNIMTRPPRNPKEPILNSFVFWRTALVAVLMTIGAIGLFFYEYNTAIAAGVEHGIALKEAQTMAVTTVVFFQIFYLFNCRSLTGSVLSVGVFSNKAVYGGIASLLGLQYVFVHWEPMQRLFATAPLDFESWLKSAAVGAIVVPVVAIEKFIRRQLRSE